MVTPSKYSLTTLSRPCQRGRVLQLPILGQSVLPGSKQATGAMEFSVRRRMLPTVYCSGAFVSVLVDRAAYLDERSFRLDFTESDFNLDDYILHGDAAEDDRPIVRLAGREGSMTVRSDGFRAAPYLALRDCCALSQLVEYAMRIRSGAVDPRSLPLFQLECCLSDRFEQDWNRVAEAVRRRR